MYAFVNFERGFCHFAFPRANAKLPFLQEMSVSQWFQPYLAHCIDKLPNSQTPKPPLTFDSNLPTPAPIPTLLPTSLYRCVRCVRPHLQPVVLGEFGVLLCSALAVALALPADSDHQ